MPKATLTFNLPEENYEHYVAVKAMDYSIAWQEVKEFLRQKIKYNKLSYNERRAFSQVQEYMYLEETDRQLPEPR